MSSYIPPDKMTVTQLQQERDNSVAHWNDLMLHGCCDPGWPDGVNLNLVRNHIIYYERLIAERRVGEQISLFGGGGAAERSKVPPRVPNNYMVADGQYAHRLDGRWNEKLHGKLVFSR